MKKYSKLEELNMMIQEGSDENDVKALFVEAIKEIIEEHKRNNQLFLDDLFNEKINAKTLIIGATEEFLDKRQLVRYVSHVSSWISYQIEQIKNDISKDDSRLKELKNTKTDSFMIIVLESIAIADNTNDLEMKKIYYMHANEYLKWVNKFLQVYVTEDIFPYKYFGNIEYFIEEILVKYY